MDRSIQSGNSLRIEHARTVTLLVTASTDFREHDAAGMAAACARNLRSAAAISFTELRREHVADYRRYADRANLRLFEGPDPLRNLATDKRMMRVKNGGEDAGLISTYFQYGRYMLISSSRPGTLLWPICKGIWTESLDPPWGSKYTVNINAEMNYWMAESANLADLHAQLFDLLDSTRNFGAASARKYYNARGFVVHHNTDIWGDSIPVDHVQAGVWPMGAAWIALHLFSHYAYNLDTAFLRDRGYPRMKEIAEFFLDYLVEVPDGTLLSGPSQSPENKYRLPDGTTASLCMSPAMDTEIIRAIFDRVSRSSKVLGIDDALRAQVEAAAKRLQPFKIGEKLARSRSGTRTMTTPSRDIAISRISSHSILTTRFRCVKLRNSPRPRAPRWSGAWVMEVAAPVGAARGSSIAGPALKMATPPMKACWPCCEIQHGPISSTSAE